MLHRNYSSRVEESKRRRKMKRLRTPNCAVATAGEGQQMGQSVSAEENPTKAQQRATAGRGQRRER